MPLLPLTATQIPSTIADSVECRLELKHEPWKSEWNIFKITKHFVRIWCILSDSVVAVAVHNVYKLSSYSLEFQRYYNKYNFIKHVIHTLQRIIHRNAHPFFLSIIIHIILCIVKWYVGIYFKIIVVFKYL